MLTNYNTILFEKKQLTDNVYLFKFKLISPLEIDFIPGQYLILKVNGRPRLYSIASANTVKNNIEFIIELIPNGLASSYFSNLKINEEVVFHGPAGQFTVRNNDKQKIFLVTGTGIAPVRSILLSNSNSKNHEVYWGLKYFKDTYLFDELKQLGSLTLCLSRENDLNMVKASDRQFFSLGHIDSCFFNKHGNFSVEQMNNFEYYLCGSREIVDSLKQFLLSKNILQENIILEKF